MTVLYAHRVERAPGVAFTSISETQRAILAVLYLKGPSTDDDIFSQLRDWDVFVSESGARTRRSELVYKGCVKDSGDYRITQSGNKTRMWTIA